MVGAGLTALIQSSNLLQDILKPGFICQRLHRRAHSTQADKKYAKYWYAAVYDRIVSISGAAGLDRIHLISFGGSLQIVPDKAGHPSHLLIDLTDQHRS